MYIKLAKILIMLQLKVLFRLFFITQNAKLLLLSSLDCSDTEFACLDGSKCVSETWFCDGSLDCLDGSDEPESCPPVSCQPSQFKCKYSGMTTFKFRSNGSD